MPFYRVNGMMVHMRGSKLPQPCQAIIKLPDGRKEYCAQSPCPQHDKLVQPGLFTGLVP